MNEPLTISITDKNDQTTSIELDLELDDSGLLFDSKYLMIDQIRGPWLSLGIHVDFQGRFVELHIGWLVVTIGRPYHKRELA